MVDGLAHYAEKVGDAQYTEKELFKEKGEWRNDQKMKGRLFNCSLYGD